MENAASPSGNGQWPRVAIVVLHFNTPALTDALADYLSRDLDYPAKRLYVIDNGSELRCRSATHRLPENLGFTRGMFEGYQIARREETFDALWLLNSDLGFEYGDRVLAELVRVLFASDRHGQIAPQQNSPHRFMENASVEAQPVPYLEPTATLIKSSTIEHVGFWDLNLTHGWGVDYDYGYRVRSSGLLNILTNRARVTHKEHRSITDISSYTRAASAEMNRVLSAKYGADWGRIMSPEPNTVPVVLTCDRTPSALEQFVASFARVRSGLAPPVVVADTSASPRLSARFLALVAALEPRAVFIHSRPEGQSVYDSVQDAARYALVCGLAETAAWQSLLFLEDDVIFSSRFLEALRGIRLQPETGFVTLYLPGHEYGAQIVDPNRFYGTQCVLFPRDSAELLTSRHDEMAARFPPGYDIRWSRFLAAEGKRLLATQQSYVQHMGTHSRLHGHGSHQSHHFVE
jgi:GT2 family glycosyltransferase